MNLLSTDLVSSSLEQFAADVRAGLTKAGQKELPSKYLYDTLGSALFEAITVLPEYGLTRADERLLTRHAGDIRRYIPSHTMVTELGSGNGRKTRSILNALREQGSFPFYPIEISHAALLSCETELRNIESVTVVGIERDYIEGLREVTNLRPKGAHLFVLFLGSTIGNFDSGADVAFMRQVRGLLATGDSVLLGTDLVKPLQVMLDAYDDPQGVTASFNLNLLGRINRELGADFDLRQFEHVARFNSATSSIEMHLRARHEQIVHVHQSEAVVHFAAGETIWTESSHKYTLQGVASLAAAAGFCPRAQWVDKEWPFANTLLVTP